MQSSMYHLFHHKLLPIFVCAISATFYAMDIDNPTQTKTLQTKNPFETEEKKVIQNYFEGPDRVDLWFNPRNMVTVEDLTQNSCEFPPCENKAALYVKTFAQHGRGICTYAAEYKDYRLTGSGNGSILISRYADHKNYINKWLEPPQGVSDVTPSVTACYLTEDKSAVLAGYSDSSLWLLNLKPKINTCICSLPKPIDLIVKGHMPHVVLTSGGGYFSVIYLDKDQGKILYKHILVGFNTQITGLAPYKCGVAVRTTEKFPFLETTEESLLYMPYSVEDLDTLEAYNFSPAQKACIVRLLGAKKLGMQPEVRESEQEAFVALPAFMQEILLGYVTLPKQYVFKTAEGAIRDYFVEPSENNFNRWFKSPDVMVDDLAPENSCEFQSCENKAAQYFRIFYRSKTYDQYGRGICSYAAEYENYLLAGSKHGYLLIKWHTDNARPVNKWLEPPQGVSFGKPVTACYLTEDKSAVLAGYSDSSLWFLDLKTKINTRICLLPKPIDLMVKGHAPHVVLTSGGGYFSIIYIDKDQGKILYKHILVGQDTQVTGLAPYKCGVGVRATEKLSFGTIKQFLLYMPYSVQDYDTLEAYNFSLAQKDCLIHLIAAKKLGMKPEIRESEKESFAALPAFMQEMLLG